MRATSMGLGLLLCATASCLTGGPRDAAAPTAGGSGTNVALRASPPADPDVVIAIHPPETSVEAVATSIAGRHVAWFEGFEGTARFSTSDPSRSQVEIRLDMTSLTMATPGLTRAVRSRSFFDVERFPRAKFVSTKITKTEGLGAYHVSGLLELHGVTRPAELDVVVVRGETFATIRGGLVFSRHAFDLIFEGAYEKLANDEVSVQVWVQTAGDAGR